MLGVQNSRVSPWRCKIWLPEAALDKSLRRVWRGNWFHDCHHCHASPIDPMINLGVVIEFFFNHLDIAVEVFKLLCLWQLHVLTCYEGGRRESGHEFTSNKKLCALHTVTRLYSSKDLKNFKCQKYSNYRPTLYISFII